MRTYTNDGQEYECYIPEQKIRNVNGIESQDFHKKLNYITNLKKAKTCSIAIVSRYDLKSGTKISSYNYPRVLSTVLETRTGFMKLSLLYSRHPWNIR
jgi:hypothetical protein